jgi:ribosomal-protein-alanine N-acetyltransferase
MTTPEHTGPATRLEIDGPDGIAIRQLTISDAERYFSLIDADREHFKYGEEITPNKYKTVEDVRASIDDTVRSHRLRFGIWDGSDMVGSINLTPKRPGVGEVGYWVGGEHKGHGYAKRAVALLIEHAFRGGDYRSLVAWVAPENVASVRTLEGVGFQRITDSGPQILYELNNSSML